MTLWMPSCTSHHFRRQGKAGLFAKKRDKHGTWKLTAQSSRVFMHRSTDQWLMESFIHSSIPRFISKAYGRDTTIDNFDQKVWLSKFPFLLGRKPSSPWLSAGWGRSLVAECWEETFMLASSTSCLLCLNNNKQANGLLCSTWEPGQHQFLMYYECQYYGFMKDFQQSIPRSLCKIYKMRGHLKLSTFLSQLYGNVNFIVETVEGWLLSTLCPSLLSSRQAQSESSFSLWKTPNRNGNGKEKKQPSI